MEASRPHNRKVAYTGAALLEQLAFVEVYLETGQLFKKAKNQLHVDGFVHIMIHKNYSVFCVLYNGHTSIY
jgi:hypothetical protein